MRFRNRVKIVQKGPLWRAFLHLADRYLADLPKDQAPEFCHCEAVMRAFLDRSSL